MKSGDIPDANIQAIASTLRFFPARYGRLDSRTDSQPPWTVPGKVSNPWIQADVGYQTYVSGVVTQGDGGRGDPDWVTTLKVSTFKVNINDTEEFVADDSGQVKVSVVLQANLQHRYSGLASRELE